MMSKATAVFLVIAAALLNGCSNQSTSGGEFESQLLEALGKVGLTRDALIEPKVPYPVSPKARLALVDQVMQDPPSMIPISRRAIDLDPNLGRGAYLSGLLRLLGQNAAPADATKSDSYTIDSLIPLLSGSDRATVTDPPPQWETTNPAAIAVRTLLFEADQARKAWERSGGTPTPAELTAIQAHIQGSLTDRGTNPDPHRLLTDAYHSVGERQDLGALTSAAVRLLSAVERNLEALRQAKPDEVTGEWQTPMGRIKVTGTGDDAHAGAYLLLIDLGGNDTYQDVARSVDPANVSIVIDLSGDDAVTWDKAQGPGAGLLGMGAWLDLAGNDRYQGQHMGLGVGLLGTGLFWDAGGNDTYHAQALSQGVGQYGVGAFLDDHGNDHYRAALHAQGYGGPGGIGMLIDQEGNDVYACDDVFPDSNTKRAARHLETRYLSMCQGYGFGLREDISGGIGLLMDRNGNDSYVSDIFGQGAAYWFGFGALIDAQGDDRYQAYEHAQGEGLHLSAGLLADWGGNDDYSGHEHVQGVGMDRSAGLLYENSGDDSYHAHRESQGAGLKSLGVGLLIEKTGHDSYQAMTDSQGYSGRPEPGFPDNEWPTGILLDLAGENHFDIPYADQVDAHGRIQNNQGIAIDYGKKP
jgi:hypothetical protein